jgi:hypothetical protein
MIDWRGAAHPFPNHKSSIVNHKFTKGACIALPLHYFITATTYGFTEKTPEGQNQQAQAAQEAAPASPQEAHLAEVILSARLSALRRRDSFSRVVLR